MKFLGGGVGRVQIITEKSLTMRGNFVLNSTKFKLLAFLGIAIVSLTVHFLIFELRYMWYLNADNASFLRIGYAVSLIVIIGLWLMFPSRFLVATTAIVSFIFPPVLRGDVFVSPNWKFMAFVLISICLLMGTTELRRRIPPTKQI